jgi:rubrerythrin
MSKSEENLREAFAGESQANRKYLAFAKKADKEGYAQVAKLFRAAAAAETVHAHAHLRTLKGVGATADNLKEAIAGETHEFKSMYPEMIEDAKAEDNKAAQFVRECPGQYGRHGGSRLLCLQCLRVHL